MERMNFAEVFPSLELNSELKELFSTVIVEKITLDQRKGFFKIYIVSRTIIERSTIKYIEKRLEGYLCPDGDGDVTIIERFEPAGKFTPEVIYKAYESSIYDLLEERGVILKHLFKSADIKFKEDSVIEIEVAKNIISEEKISDIVSFLKDIFKYKFGIDVTIKSNLAEEKKGRYIKQNEEKLKREVKNIVSNSINSKKTHEDVPVDIDAGKKEKKKSGILKSFNPDMLYGREFQGEAMPISEIQGEYGQVIVHGQIFNMELKETKSEWIIATFALTDFTDSIKVKIFLKPDQKDEFTENIRKGDFVIVKAVAAMDAYDKEIGLTSVVGIKRTADFTAKRSDDSLEKRVELHCHTKMSDMDGVSDVGKIVKRAYEWGHKAIAITDHGVVQAFPDAWHTFCDLKADAKKQNKDFDFKVIYGVEAYLVDDLKDMILNPNGQSLDDLYVAFDIETTGFNPLDDRIIEIGAVKIKDGKIIDNYSAFINPHIPIPYRIEQLTGINDEMVADAKDISEALPEFLEFCRGAVMVAHNAEFDMSFISANAKNMGLPCEFTVVDTVTMSRFLITGIGKFKLNNVAKALNVSLENHHRALDDAKCCGEIFIKLCERLKYKGITDLNTANEKGKASENVIRRAPSYHAIILVKNNIGRVNLYKIISDSHINTYANGHPRVLKSDYLAHSEGLIIGSACEAGELYQAILRGRSEQETARLARFYDYLEIQPLGNNGFMVKTGIEKIDSRKKFLVDSEEDLKEVNRKIVKLGEQFHKPVVATCDVHFLDPEDEIYRRIIQSGNGYKDADNQPPLYLRTTEEMLGEFEYLGKEKAWEVVIKNTNYIADMIEDISPIHPDKCPPQIPDSDKTLREICYKKAHEMYGEQLPTIVEERLEKELNSIISNGFAVMYIMAQKLVWKSNEDGYLVGSRGSVGSSFVATMAGITEVNPLKPHYYCKKCKYSDFESDIIKAHDGGSGFDLPDAVCPVCGEPLAKDGFDIPFETFLGFNGDKEPDIDLNFSGEYQSNAHDYTEVMFGKGHTFRAGTITGLADKTAYGYVKNYFEERGIGKRRCEIDRLTLGCTGIRKSTGQHPGGIVIVPQDKEIYDFTPVQKPANDMNAKSVTTHFEYHAIDRNLLKLDILGHDDPTMIKKLEEYTDTDAKKIPFDDKKVMSLFEGTEALGIKPEDIGGVKLGSLGIPELGTEFVIQMLIDAKPKNVADLVRISGLSHGTDVWSGNAQTLVQEGKATISTAICTRDDIMTYLIRMGVEPGLSFTIMESVRKGKGVKPEWEEEMLSHGVPDWYIWSCKKIKYMFPKAHAAAYIMMALRIAYYKVYYPLAYYAAYFSIRAKAFNYEIMCMGKEKLNHYIEEYEYRIKEKQSTKKDEDTLKDMRIVQEMYARGFEFMPIDIYRANAHYFRIIDGTIMPSFDSIDGLGETAAEGIVEAVKDGRFISKEDFRERCKVSKTVIECMSRLGILDGLPEANQLSIFDFS